MRTLIMLLACATVASASARAQSPAHSPASSGETAPAFAHTQSSVSSGEAAPGAAHAQSPSSGEAPPAPPPNFAYHPDGRRDPFVSLVNRSTDTGVRQAGRSRPDGPGGLMVDEVVVRGIVQSRSDWVAMVGSPNGRTYSIRPGDRLMDGNVHSMTSQAVVLMQDVNDPLSLQKQREVRKYLRGEVK